MCLLIIYAQRTDCMKGVLNMVKNIKTIKELYICDCCSANFTVEENRSDKEYKVKCCPFCGNEYLTIKPITH